MGLIAALLASCRKGVVGEPEGRRGERETLVSHRSLLNGMSKQTLALPVSSQSPWESTPGPCSEGGGKVGKVQRHPLTFLLGKATLTASGGYSPASRLPSWLRWEDPLRTEWQPTPVFLPGEFHGQRSLAESVGLHRV